MDETMKRFFWIAAILAAPLFLTGCNRPVLVIEEQEEETENGGTGSGWETGGVFLKVIHRQVMWVDADEYLDSFIGKPRKQSLRYANLQAPHHGNICN